MFSVLIESGCYDIPQFHIIQNINNQFHINFIIQSACFQKVFLSLTSSSKSCTFESPLHISTSSLHSFLCSSHPPLLPRHISIAGRWACALPLLHSFSSSFVFFFSFFLILFLFFPPPFLLLLICFENTKNNNNSKILIFLFR